MTNFGTPMTQIFKHRFSGFRQKIQSNLCLKIWVICIPFHAVAQKTDVLPLDCVGSLLREKAEIKYLPVVQILDFQFNRSGYTTTQTDTTPTATTAAELLLAENLLALRTNAPGTLATPAPRGLGGNRTAVLWQGIPLQSPMNGYADLALMPLWPGDRATVQLGGQSAALGSGAVGGAILFDSKSIPIAIGNAPGISGDAALGMGSFGESSGAASLRFSGKFGTAQLRGQAFSAANNFPFRNTSQVGQPLVRQPHNRVERLDFQHLGQFFLGKNWLLETAAWRQKASREIPPSMTEAPNNAQQWDESWRASTTLRRALGQKSALALRLVWLDESLVFREKTDVDTSRSRTGIAETHFSTQIFGKTAAQFGLQIRHDRAQADGYADSLAQYAQTRPLAWAAISRPFHFGRLTALARQEFLEGKNLPLTWSLAGEFIPEKTWSLKFHLAKNFNVPTFNDRFWRLYGNPNLRPETSHSADIGLIFKHLDLAAQTTLFSILVDDWIQWLPDASGLFHPGNLRQVWSRGAELSISGKKKWKKTRLTWTARYSFTRATNLKVYAPNDPSLGRQLPFVPEHAGSFSLKIERGRAGLRFVQSVTGRRFSTPDNSAAVAGFSVGNLAAWWRISLKTCVLRLDGSLGNVWDSG